MADFAFFGAAPAMWLAVRSPYRCRNRRRGRAEGAAQRAALHGQAVGYSRGGPDLLARCCGFVWGGACLRRACLRRVPIAGARDMIRLKKSFSLEDDNILCSIATKKGGRGPPYCWGSRRAERRST